MSSPSDNFTPLQSSFFYEGVFHAEEDHTLLESLVAQKKKDAWNSTNIPDESLQVARLTVNHIHGTKLTLEDVVKRMKLMKERWRTFVRVANYDGAIWDYPNNYISADDKTWSKIFKKYPLGQAYRYKGDPEFHNLAMLFGSSDIKEEGSKGLVKRGGDKIVINISSTNAEDSHSNATLVLSEDDEVTSPVLKSTR